MEYCTIYRSVLLSLCLHLAHSVKPQIGIVFLPGRDIDAEGYANLLEEVSARLRNDSLEVFLDVIHPPKDGMTHRNIHDKIFHSLHNLQSQGLRRLSPTLLGAHSDTSLILQDFVNHAARAGVLRAQNIIAQLLLSSYLQRKYDTVEYPMPTLTISGEMDGVNRITRVAELFRSNILKERTRANDNFVNFPVLIVPGVNHTSFLSMANLPDYATRYDLEAPCTNAKAVSIVGEMIADYILVQLNVSQAAHNRHIQRQMMNSHVIDQVLISQNLESYYNTLPPCYEQTRSDACQVGCLWSTVVQKMLLNHTNLVFYSDELHIIGSDLSLRPVRNATHAATVTQNVYARTDDKSSISPISASELKMLLNIDPSDDRSNLCALINRFTIRSMLDRVADSEAGRRYRKRGRKVEVGDDVLCDGLKEWSGQSLVYDDESANASLVVRSPIYRRGGLLACKLLSPHRVMEWIYVDSLRNRDHSRK